MYRQPEFGTAGAIGTGESNPEARGLLATKGGIAMKKLILIGIGVIVLVKAFYLREE